MRTRGSFCICILLFSIFIAGCIENDAPEPREPVEGDLSLSIKMDQNHYSEPHDKIIVNITLENIGSDVVLVDKILSVYKNIYFNITDFDGNRIRLGNLHYGPAPQTYPELKPGEEIFREIDLMTISDNSEIQLGDEEFDFNWDISGYYNILASFIGTPNHLKVVSNTIGFRIIGDERPEEYSPFIKGITEFKVGMNYTLELIGAPPNSTITFVLKDYHDRTYEQWRFKRNPI